MRVLATWTGALLFAASVVAQSPLQIGLTPSNQGNLGGGLYFDLAVQQAITITQLDSWVGTLGMQAGDLEMEVWLGPASYFGNLTTPGLWTHVATATATGYARATLYASYAFVLAAPLALAPGEYGVALRASAQPTASSVAWNHAYTNGTGCSSSQLPGSCPNTVHGNAEVVVRGGAAQNAFFTAPIFSPRMWSGALHYGLGGQGVQLARLEPFGQSCAGGVGTTRLAPRNAPGLGRDLAADLVDAPSAFTLGFAVYGLSNTAWYYVPLPLELGFYGMPGCRQYTDIVATATFGPQARIEGNVPNAAALSGLRFYVQAVVPDPAAPNVVGAVTTNALAGRIGL